MCQVVFNPSPWEVEQVPRQPRLFRKTLSRKKKNTKKQNKISEMHIVHLGRKERDREYVSVCLCVCLCVCETKSAVCAPVMVELDKH